MNFIVDRAINNNIFTVNISFDSYGSEEFTEESEQELVKKYGCPLINAGGEPFIGKLIYDDIDDSIKVSADGEEALLVLNSKVVPVNENFKVSYSIDVDSIKNTETTELLNSALKVAEAKCALFENGILERITESLNTIKGNMTGFERGYPDKITI